MLIFLNGLKDGLEKKLYLNKYIKRNILQKSNEGGTKPSMLVE